MRTLKITLLLLVLPFLNFAQEYDAGVFAGVTAYQGDLSNSNLDFNEINLGYGAYYRYQFTNYFAFRGSFMMGKVSGNDKYSSKELRRQRGYSFSSSVMDVSAVAELDVFGLNVAGPTSIIKRKFSPYLFIGIGGGMYTPKVKTTEKALHALDAKQGKSSYSLSIPMGVGFRYNLSKVTIGLEGSLRQALSDYVDGISFSGNPDFKDWYGYMGLTLGYRFGAVSGAGYHPSSKVETTVADDAEEAVEEVEESVEEATDVPVDDADEMEDKE